MSHDTPVARVASVFLVVALFASGILWAEGSRVPSAVQGQAQPVRLGNQIAEAIREWVEENLGMRRSRGDRETRAKCSGGIDPNGKPCPPPCSSCGG